MCLPIKVVQRWNDTWHHSSPGTWHLTPAMFLSLRSMTQDGQVPGSVDGPVETGFDHGGTRAGLLKNRAKIRFGAIRSWGGCGRSSSSPMRSRCSLSSRSDPFERVPQCPTARQGVNTRTFPEVSINSLLEVKGCPKTTGLGRSW